MKGRGSGIWGRVKTSRLAHHDRIQVPQLVICVNLRDLRAANGMRGEELGPQMTQMDADRKKAADRPHFFLRERFGPWPEVTCPAIA